VAPALRLPHRHRGQLIGAEHHNPREVVLIRSLFGARATRRNEIVRVFAD
jgi:hypothetical protein